MKRNAIILAAGFSSRFLPLSEKHPKGLTRVKGEILVERQIRQLREAGIEEIILVTGYKKEQFSYLGQAYGVLLVENKEFAERNNHASIYAAKCYLGNTYICSSDNYFTINPFLPHLEHSYYAAVFSAGPTREWCLNATEEGLITGVTVGGFGSWYMLGHAYWSEDFSKRFLEFLEKEYNHPETRHALWEDLYCRHMESLPLFIRKYPAGTILEFDTVSDLAAFDSNYRNLS